MNSGDWVVLLGDGLILVGLGLTFIIYRRERSAANQRDIDSVLAMLTAVRDGMLPWGDLYFGTGYDEQRATDRAKNDFDWVMSKNYGQVFRVPVEPLTALILRPGEGRLVQKETIEAANIALWKIGVFNQLVGQQADFNARHIAEFYDSSLPELQRQVLAEGARAISKMLHLDGIGDAGWYQKLKDAVEASIELLTQRRQRNTWWANVVRRPWKA